jgi:hypothetical protein
MTGPYQAFGIDDEVEIIETGERFHVAQIVKLQTGEMQYSGWSEGKYYPASSLRLVPEELKIGDYAIVVLPDNHFTGKIGKVADVSGGEHPVCLENMGVWSKDALRKPTPEEVAKHTRKNITLKLDTSEFEAGIDKAIAKLWKLQVEQRLAAIEKRQEKIDHWMDRFAKVGARWETEKADLEKRLAFLESSQKPRKSQLTTIGEIAVFGSFGPVPHCIAEMIQQETEKAKKRKAEGQ